MGDAASRGGALGATDGDGLADVLAAHRYRDLLGDYEIAPYYCHFGCSCGWEQRIDGMSGWRSWRAAHDIHVAAAVRAHVAATAPTTPGRIAQHLGLDQ